MNPRWRLSAGLAAGMLSLGSAVSAQAPARELRGIARRLELTAAGAGRWLEALGVTPDTKTAERLMALTSTGRLLATRDGGESSVSLGAELDRELLAPGNAIVLVHNHPGNAGLSANDLGQLTKPGVAAVVAVGHDGSIYVAARGRRYDAERIRTAAVRPAADRTEETSAGRVRSARLDDRRRRRALQPPGGAGARQGRCHRVRGVLAGGSRTSFEAGRVPLGRVAVGAAARVR